MPEETPPPGQPDVLDELTAPFTPRPGEIAEAVHHPQEPDAVSFPIVLRGYDRLAVDAYVRHAQRRIAEAEVSSSPQGAVRHRLEQVGDEVSGILQRAHETAEKITAQARRDAELEREEARRDTARVRAEAGDVLEAARREAADMRVRAERQLSDLDAETDRIWDERHRIVEDARDLARQLTALADAAAERFPADEDSPAGERAMEMEGDPGQDTVEHPPPEPPAETQEDSTQATVIMPVPEQRQ